MKTLLTILAFLFSSFMFGQIPIGTYKLTGDTSTLGGNILFSSLTLNNDQSFRYEYRNSISCFLWYDITGKWSIKQDTLILTDSLIDLEQSHYVYHYINTHQDYILITLKTKGGRKLKGVKVSYHFSNNTKPTFFWTNNKGEVEIPIKEFLKMKPPIKDGEDFQTTFIIDYNKNKIKINSNHYFKGISNVIDCVINENPHSDTLLRQTYYKADNKILVFLKHNIEIDSKEHLHTYWGNFKFVGQ